MRNQCRIQTEPAETFTKRFQSFPQKEVPRRRGPYAKNNRTLRPDGDCTRSEKAMRSIDWEDSLGLGREKGKIGAGGSLRGHRVKREIVKGVF